MVLKCCCFILCLMYAAGFRFDDPCNVRPSYAGIPDNDDFTFDVNVPSSCRNGTFIWSYPRGHAMLKFHNTRRKSTLICIRDSMDGDLFTITDMTENKSIGPIEYKHWACTSAIRTKEIVLKVDARWEKRYIGAVEYKLVTLNSKLK